MKVQTRGPQERSLMAAVLITTYGLIVGFSDNYVRLTAETSGLWQFHLTRGLIALPLLGLAALLLGLGLRPKRWRPVALRSGLMGIAIMIYFGAMGFVPVAVAAAGLFTAPIWVALIQSLFFGEKIGLVQTMAVAAGFAGVLLVLGPSAFEGPSLLAAVMPVVGGLFYGLANIATRRWCEGESASALLAGFFLSLGLFGVLGLIVLQLWPQEVPPGAAGFVLRGWVTPDLSYLAWMLMHAAFSCLGVGLSIRAYILAEASRVSVMEYVLLPTAAFWGWIIWADELGLQAWIGMALIIAAGTIIVLYGRRAEMSPVAL